jgi:GMP synthase (glutamine-hydrolysing)
MKRILLLHAGTAAAAVRVAHGDYDRWFARAIPADRFALRVVAAHLGEALPRRARDHDAVIMSGSPLSVTDGAPWMRRAGAYLREAAEQGVPVLGVCFGHQLLAETYGATVRRNPRGRELGTVECRLTGAGERDPLFEGVPAAFAVQATHEDHVEDVPAALEVLAANGSTPVQAFRSGPLVRAVQFHPELDAAALRTMVESRIPLLEREARARGAEPRAHVREILASIGPAPYGARVLANFLARFT